MSDTTALRQLLDKGMAFELPDASFLGRDVDLQAHATGATRFSRLSDLHRATREHGGRCHVDAVVDERGEQQPSRHVGAPNRSGRCSG